jgi:hypothetical protein
MERQVSKKPTPKQRQNMQFSEDRFELLEIIHEMISDELERRGISETGMSQQEKTYNIPPTNNKLEKQSFWGGICGNVLPLPYIIDDAETLVCHK